MYHPERNAKYPRTATAQRHSCVADLRISVALVILFVHFEEGREALEDTPNECIFQLMACIQNGSVNIIQKVPIQPQQMLDGGKDGVNLPVR